MDFVGQSCIPIVESSIFYEISFPKESTPYPTIYIFQVLALKSRLNYVLCWVLIFAALQIYFRSKIRFENFSLSSSVSYSDVFSCWSYLEFIYLLFILFQLLKTSSIILLKLVYINPFVFVDFSARAYYLLHCSYCNTPLETQTSVLFNKMLLIHPNQDRKKSTSTISLWRILSLCSMGVNGPHQGPFPLEAMVLALDCLLFP